MSVVGLGGGFSGGVYIFRVYLSSLGFIFLVGAIERVEKECC